jgi:hypothetical protein
VFSGKKVSPVIKSLLIQGRSTQINPKKKFAVRPPQGKEATWTLSVKAQISRTMSAASNSISLKMSDLS